MLQKILFIQLAFVFYARSECSPKLLSDMSIPGTVCDSINARNPWDRMIFSIGINRTPGDYYDSAHLAVLKVQSEELFSKYDMRISADTATPIKPPLKQIDYGYAYLLIRAGTVDSIINEPYVQSLFFRSTLPTTMLSGSPRVGQSASKARNFFNANGARSEKSTAPRFLWQK